MNVYNLLSDSVIKKKNLLSDCYLASPLVHEKTSLSNNSYQSTDSRFNQENNAKSNSKGMEIQ